MNEFFIEFAISTVFSLLKGLTKDPKRKETYKRVFLKIRDTITLTYDGVIYADLAPEEEVKPKKK